MKKELFYLLAVILLFSCSKQTTTQQRPIPVSVLPIDSISIVPTHTYMGELENAASIQLAFQTAGRVSQLKVKIGQRVRANQLLAKLDDTQAQAALSAAQVTLQQAEDGLRRAQNLYDKNGISEVKYIEVKTQAEQARAMEAIARQNFANCTLIAPQDGVIGELHLLPGEVVLPAQPVMTLLSDDALQASFTVSENEIGRIRIGDTGRILVPAVSDQWIAGSVTEKSLIAGKIAHTYTVKMRFVHQGDWMPGMVAKVQLDEQVSRGILIPAHCVQTSQEGLLVWKLQNGQAIRQVVELQDYAKNGVLIKSGISAGDTIITDGFQKLYYGARISPTIAAQNQ